MHGRRKRIAELCIFLASRSVFLRIVFDWLPSDTKRVLNREMHQDFSVNARVPPKRTLERLENTSSALSLPNQCPGSPPSLSVHYLCTQSVLNQQNPNIAFNRTHIKRSLYYYHHIQKTGSQTRYKIMLSYRYRHHMKRFIQRGS